MGNSPHDYQFERCPSCGDKLSKGPTIPQITSSVTKATCVGCGLQWEARNHKGGDQELMLILPAS